MKRFLLCALVVACVGLAVSSDRVKGQTVATTVHVTAIGRVGGGFQISWDDGFTQFYNSVDDIRESIAINLSDVERVKLMDLAWWLARSPDGSNTNLVVGKSMTVDWSAPQPIKVQ